jgi:hypothetical protein
MESAGLHFVGKERETKEQRVEEGAVVVRGITNWESFADHPVSSMLKEHIRDAKQLTRKKCCVFGKEID